MAAAEAERQRTSLFHARRAEIRGETLYPLNQLEAIYPDIDARERAKYAGREQVPDFRIPLLDALWNDTLHLSPIHPRHLVAAWRAAGIWAPVWDLDFYEIPVTLIAELPAVWFASEAFWVNNSPCQDVPLSSPSEDFNWFDPSTYRELEGPRSLTATTCAPNKLTDAVRCSLRHSACTGSRANQRGRVASRASGRGVRRELTYQCPEDCAAGMISFRWAQDRKLILGGLRFSFA